MLKLSRTQEQWPICYTEARDKREPAKQSASHGCPGMAYNIDVFALNRSFGAPWAQEQMRFEEL
ncbi:hypothetical protein [Phytopseudomonas dryadis]|uniref:Uncharacterized protein n=1 Tax=Phytopseudomonas dryadis TaxID=2487520 RepID=A0A4Q9R9S6_9GAMM|nr:MULTISPECIES: hypothetical protein [Pseudomonas]TBU97465.1 hypothetical protein DNK44_00310 [Pseudomonas dryadis]TBV09937.1 hypothetical protein DNK34_00410 [Pseudomonas dryadis]TBV15580.1 hypothetical protein DNK41_17280 [Pseudomonas sp. FRB 230]